jgi:NDP-sugar pyrophosphorylase family protein
MPTTPNDLGVAILAGGLGTRLRQAVADRPKVLAPVAGRPFLCYLLDQLIRWAIDEVVLLVGHRAGQVRAALGESYQGIRLVYSVESTPLGTAGAVRLALPHFRAGHLLLLNGDSFCDFDLPSLCQMHDERAAGATLALCEVPDTARFGRVRQDSGGRVVCFEEKGDSSGAGWINAGVYLLRRDLIGAIAPGRPLSLERDLFPGWVQSGQVWGQRTSGRFLDIGTPTSYAQAEAFFAGQGVTVG